MKKFLKGLCCLSAISLMATNCLSLNAFAWGTSTHRNIITSAFDILKEDHKDDVYNFYKNNYQAYCDLIQETQSPDWEEAIPGTHYYVYKNEPSNFGKYCKNANGNYSRSARTRFEEHYSTAINQYKNGNVSGSFDSLGRAIHYLCDIGCPPHSAGIRYPLVGENKHAKFETFGDENCKKYMTTSASKLYKHVLSSDFETILNELAKTTSAYAFAIKEASDTSFNVALKETIPLSQQYTAAILNRFFKEVNDPSIQYIKDNSTYYINMANSNMYLDSYYNTLKVYKEVKNEYQKFILRLNSDGSYHISPIYDKSKALAVNATDTVVMKDYSLSDESQKFKIVYYPDETARIVSAKSKYDYILGKSLTKAITVQDFSPENESQRFTFLLAK